MIDRLKMIEKAGMYPNSLEAMFIDLTSYGSMYPEWYAWELILEKQYDQEFLYPIKYDGRIWYEADCDDVFTAFYNHRSCFNSDGAIRMFGNDWIYPDGIMIID